jgi:hypothetical protein
MRKNKTLLAVALATAIAAPLAQADDAGSTSISGVLFIDFTDISTTQDAPVVPAGAKALPKTGDIDPNGLGLDVKRAYLIVNHSFDDVWSAYLNTDFNFASYKAASTSTSTPAVTGGTPGETVTTTTTTNTTVTTPETQLFIKKAYLQGHFDDWATLRIGSADTPWTGYVEGVYGYRFIENTMTDRSGFANTADWGVNLAGGDGLVNYSASILNGNGYKNPSRSKSVDEEFRLGVTPLGGALIFGIGGYAGHRGQDMEATPAVNTASRWDALAAWKADGLTAGVEWFSADKWNNVLTPVGTPTTKSEGLSLFASYAFPGTDWAVFARHDDVKPTQDTDSSQQDQYYNLGVAWKYNTSITWAFAYKSDKVTDNLKYNLGSDDLKTEEFGIWAQVKF